MTATCERENCSAPEAFEIAEIRTVAGLEALSSEWFELWERSGAMPFQSPMWLIPWGRCFTSGNLVALALRADGRLAALAPFYTWADPESGERKLLLLGNGISDYLDICVA